jgi:hypothetical protein
VHAQGLGLLPERVHYFETAARTGRVRGHWSKIEPSSLGHPLQQVSGRKELRPSDEHAESSGMKRANLIFDFKDYKVDRFA